MTRIGDNFKVVVKLEYQLWWICLQICCMFYVQKHSLGQSSLSLATVHFCQEVICYPNLVQKISHFGLGQFYFLGLKSLPQTCVD